MVINHHLFVGLFARLIPIFGHELNFEQTTYRRKPKLIHRKPTPSERWSLARATIRLYTQNFVSGQKTRISLVRFFFLAVLCFQFVLAFECASQWQKKKNTLQNFILNVRRQQRRTIAFEFGIGRRYARRKKERKEKCEKRSVACFSDNINIEQQQNKSINHAPLSNEKKKWKKGRWKGIKGELNRL